MSISYGFTIIRMKKELMEFWDTIANARLEREWSDAVPT